MVAAMQQIADWLKKLGTRLIFPDLADQHLEKLGVALGDRLVILWTIRELGRPPPVSSQNVTAVEQRLLKVARLK
jgi:hypothetical protein